MFHLSHHLYLEDVAMSGGNEIQTVLGNIPMDIDFMTRVAAEGGKRGV